MKTFVLSACVLAIATAVYGADVNEVKEFHDNYAVCVKELGVPVEPITTDIFACVIDKDGTTIDKDGKITHDTAMKKLEDLISDPGKLEQAKKIVTKCINDAYQGPSSIKEQTIRCITCSLPVVALFD